MREEQFRMQEEEDPQEVQTFKKRVGRKTRAERIATQSHVDNLRKQYTTSGASRAHRYLNRNAAATTSTRTELTVNRAQVEGTAAGVDNIAILWINVSPWRKTTLTNYLTSHG